MAHVLKCHEAFDGKPKGCKFRLQLFRRAQSRSPTERHGLDSYTAAQSHDFGRRYGSGVCL